MNDDRKRAILANIAEANPVLEPGDITVDEYIEFRQSNDGVCISDATARRHLDSDESLRQVRGVYDPDAGRTRTVWRQRDV